MGAGDSDGRMGAMMRPSSMSVGRGEWFWWAIDEGLEMARDCGGNGYFVGWSSGGMMVIGAMLAVLEFFGFVDWRPWRLAWM